QRRPAVAHAERGREEPAGDVDVRFGGGDVGDDPRQQLRAVDEQLGGTAGVRGERAALRPAPRGRVDRLPVAAAPQPAAVMGTDRALEPVPEQIVETVERIRRAHARYCGPPLVVVGGGGGGSGAVVGGGGGGGVGVGAGVGAGFGFGCGAGAAGVCCVVVGVV